MSNQFINKASVHMFYKNSNHKFEMKTPQAERTALLGIKLRQYSSTCICRIQPLSILAV